MHNDHICIVRGRGVVDLRPARDYIYGTRGEKIPEKGSHPTCMVTDLTIDKAPPSPYTQNMLPINPLLNQGLTLYSERSRKPLPVKTLPSFDHWLLEARGPKTRVYLVSFQDEGIHMPSVPHLGIYSTHTPHLKKLLRLEGASLWVDCRPHEFVVKVPFSDTTLKKLIKLLELSKS